MLGMTFYVIDTPGLSDTKGVKHDDVNVVKILSAAENCRSLAAVVLIVNGSVARSTVNLKNTLVRLRGSMPDSILSNILVVLTNCSEIDYNFDVKSLKPWKVPEENIFLKNVSG